MQLSLPASRVVLPGTMLVSKSGRQLYLHSLALPLRVRLQRAMKQHRLSQT